jgi:DNA-binding NtrC family response regulator
MATQRVLSIGQCGADHAALAAAIRRYFQAEVVPAETATEALTELRNGNFALVLVNRILDADGSSGIDLVNRLKKEDHLENLPVMLVSNYQDSQREAVKAGAVPGFGKGVLGQPEMIGRLTPFLRPADA